MMELVGPELSLQPELRIPILVVDDDESMRNTLSFLLSKAGYLVTVAENGQQAFDLFSRDSFSLVVTDFSMPVMDGLTLAEKLRVHSPETPIIMITGSRILEGVATGCVDYIIPKPFQLTEIQRTVEKALIFVRKPRIEMHA
jgi:CheY-like chemotaxis protein